jgi:hypothetical protein
MLVTQILPDGPVKGLSLPALLASRQKSKKCDDLSRFFIEKAGKKAIGSNVSVRLSSVLFQVPNSSTLQYSPRSQMSPVNRYYRV